MLRRTVATTLVAGVLSGACAEDDATVRLRTFTECVTDGGGSVGDDAYLATDETGRPLAVVGEVQADEALLSECLTDASD